MKIAFSVIGQPGAKGSKSRDRHGRMYESSSKVQPWESAVAWSAVAALNGAPRPIFPRDVPVRLTVEFFLRRPSSGKGAKRKYPTTIPDADKVTRSTADALTQAGVYRDDAQVVDLIATKRYADSERSVGAFITVEEMP